jgi:hypothetical protein
MTAEFDAILDELVTRHGGDRVLGLSGLAVLRQVAALLSAGDLDASGATTIASLTSLLPPLPGPTDEESTWDLSRLTDQQLADLDALAKQACGGEPRAESAVEETLRRAADQLTELTSERTKRWAAEDEAHELRSRLCRIETELQQHQDALREVAKALAASEEGKRASAADDAPAASASAGDNVVRLRPSEAPDCQPCLAPAGRFHPDIGA